MINPMINPMINKEHLNQVQSIHERNIAVKDQRKSAVNNLPKEIPVPRPDQRLKVPLALRAKT